jgi:hypothetical protein
MGLARCGGGRLLRNLLGSRRRSNGRRSYNGRRRRRRRHLDRKGRRGYDRLFLRLFLLFLRLLVGFSLYLCLFSFLIVGRYGSQNTRLLLGAQAL